jgi:hypothetical protein
MSPRPAGAGAVDASKYLLGFCGVTPTRTTLKMALSTGYPEMIRLIWQRLPEEQDRRLDLLEISADFHREAPLGWLFRDSNEIEREVFAECALERHLADALLVGLRNGPRPWSWRTRELAASWPAAGSGIVFGSAPNGIAAGSR